MRTAALASASASVDDLVEAAVRDPSVAVRRFASWQALTRLPAHLGVAPGNRTAIALLRTTAWWELTSRSSEVRAVLAAHPN
ncbi:hypothetical protein [Demequina silvatica]|uniref:hypothetical protein n=1 Tax=Demequina silvatica TaxID=1638988 RepID=UPI000782955B|nr:hypothetical protein [Demequina silvatica]